MRTTAPPLAHSPGRRAPSRRQVLSYALAGLGAAAATSACSPSAPTGPRDFTFWSFTGIGQKADVERYMSANPGVTIKLTEVGSSQETAQALTTAIAGGKVPDLALVQAADLPKFALSPDNFVDYRRLGGDDVGAPYLDWVIAQATTRGGQVIGIPTDVGGLAVAYRKDLFAAAGLPTDRDEVSALWPDWPSFIETGRRYTEATGNAFVDNAATSVFYQALGQVSEQFYDADGGYAYTNPQVRQAFDWSLDALAAGISARVDSFGSAWNAGIGRGAFAVTCSPSWMLGTIKSQAPDLEGQWDLATIPNGIGNWGGSYLAIPAAAERKEAAWEYVRSVQSPASQLQHFVDAGSLPTTPENYSEPELADFTDPYFSNAPTGAIFTKAVLDITPFPVGRYTAEIGTELQNAIKAVELSAADPAQAWAKGVRNVEIVVGDL
ncbi:ABC transporter substrate-binding protein [Quadrisphaera setariae]|uniref:Extracellular solute-binding protein n=1 Tax=Quadrisphaera setariae TaxID=2593304 RepID=A0A5C8ZFZ6_9ACTN|nr:extracellular solute-binding protein [Quadrisphaera setariae]TXR56965.1 extracellular solute-binding protein [Quadrisphaera setariae]